MKNIEKPKQLSTITTLKNHTIMKNFNFVVLRLLITTDNKCKKKIFVMF